MIVDSSAIVAVLREEPGHEELEQKMVEAEMVAIGAPTLVETEIVIARIGGGSGEAAVSELREKFDLTVVSFDEAHSDVAAQAFLRFGKGRHPAALNYGDCMTYATARVARRPLLFRGNDFARTDLEAA